MPLVLEELLDEAPVTWALSYGGPLLPPPIMLSELIADFPRDMPRKEIPVSTICSTQLLDLLPPFPNIWDVTGCNLPPPRPTDSHLAPVRSRTAL